MYVIFLIYVDIIKNYFDNIFIIEKYIIETIWSNLYCSNIVLKYCENFKFKLHI